MNLKKRKIIAREFLILLLVVVLGFIAFACTYPYNYFLNSSVSKLNSEIISQEKQLDSIEEPYKNKIAEQKRVYEGWMKNDKLDRSAYRDFREHWARLEYLHKQDSISFKYNNVWNKVVIDHLKNMGFTNASQLNEFIGANSITEIDNKTETKSKQLKDKIFNLREKYRNKKEEILHFDDQMDFALIILLFGGILAFPIRFLIYGVRWSINTLKTKE